MLMHMIVNAILYSLHWGVYSRALFILYFVVGES